MEEDNPKSNQISPEQKESDSVVSRSQFLKRLGLGSVALLLPGCESSTGTTEEPEDQRDDENNATNQQYYVDASGGDDANEGTSSEQPWASLQRVNQTQFKPGDQILLKAGEAWSGVLHPGGSGTEEAPIQIGRYGPEGAPSPLVNGDGAKAAVYLYNQEYWEIRDLEITNMAADIAHRAGVFVKAKGLGRKARHIHLQNLYVHDVKGDNQGEMAGNPRYTGGIMARAQGEGTEWHDLKIEGCRISSVDRVGIHVQGGGSNLRAQNNTISDTGGDGAIFNDMDKSCIVQHNVAHDLGMRIKGKPIAGIWTWNCHGSVIQKNEAYKTHIPPGSGDGVGFDTDLPDNGVIYQYNYSHDNEGGFILVVGHNAKIRYNISQNDGEKALTAPTPGGVIIINRPEAGNNQIYNNTFYVKEGRNTPMVNGKPKDRKANHFTNNIFYNLGSGGYQRNLNSVYDHNLYYGNHPDSEPDGSNKITADPQLVDPGGGGTGRDSVGGYKLEAGSPAIGSGKLIVDNGERDYFGNEVPSSAAPNRGASENRP